MLSRILFLPLCALSRFILFTIGWSLVDDDIFAHIKKHNRTVLIYAHSSYMDFFIVLLYIFSYPDRLINNLKILVQPRPFKYFGWFLRYIGGIPASRLEDRNGGAVSRIAEELKPFNEFLLLISPKGTISKAPWRTGYYHIAKALDVPLMIGAFDYEKRISCVSEPISSQLSESEVRAYLLSKLADVVPLHPEASDTQLRPYDPNKIGIVDTYHLLKCISVYYLIYMILSRYM